MPKQKAKSKTQKDSEIDVIRGLLKIAAIAMPDTYWSSDSRIEKARKYMKEHGIGIDIDKEKEDD